MLRYVPVKRNGTYIKDYAQSGGYRRLAEYLNKERTDGIIIPINRHPWSCSRSLNAKVPVPERWRDSSGTIAIPESSVWGRRGETANDFGAYHYASWIDGDLLLL